MATNFNYACKNMTDLRFEKALTLFLDKFLELHPKSEWPSWFKSHTTYGGSFEGSDHWRFSFTVLPKSAIPEDYLWEKKDDGYALTKIDPKTGDKMFVISNVSEHGLSLFECEVDTFGVVKVLLDSDLNSIEVNDLLPLRC